MITLHRWWQLGFTESQSCWEMAHWAFSLCNTIYQPHLPFTPTAT